MQGSVVCTWQDPVLVWFVRTLDARCVCHILSNAADANRGRDPNGRCLQAISKPQASAEADLAPAPDAACLDSGVPGTTIKAWGFRGPRNVVLGLMPLLTGIAYSVSLILEGRVERRTGLTAAHFLDSRTQ